MKRRGSKGGNNVVTLTIKQQRPVPDALAVVFDFGVWTITFFTAGRFRYRIQQENEEIARAEAERLVTTTRLTWQPVDERGRAVSASGGGVQ